MAGPGCASTDQRSPDRAISRGRPEGVANAPSVPRTATEGAGTGEGPCPGGSRADGMPPWFQLNRLPGGAGGVANDAPASRGCAEGECGTTPLAPPGGLGEFERAARLSSGAKRRRGAGVSPAERAAGATDRRSVARAV